MYNCEAIHDVSPEIVLIWLRSYLFYFWRFYEQKANADVHNTGDGVTLKDAEAIGAFAEGMIDLF